MALGGLAAWLIAICVRPRGIPAARTFGGVRRVARRRSVNNVRIERRVSPTRRDYDRFDRFGRFELR